VIFVVGLLSTRSNLPLVDCRTHLDRQSGPNLPAAISNMMSLATSHLISRRTLSVMKLNTWRLAKQHLRSLVLLAPVRTCHSFTVEPTSIVSLGKTCRQRFLINDFPCHILPNLAANASEVELTPGDWRNNIFR